MQKNRGSLRQNLGAILDEEALINLEIGGFFRSAQLKILESRSVAATQKLWYSLSQVVPVLHKVFEIYALYFILRKKNVFYAVGTHLTA